MFPCKTCSGSSSSCLSCQGNYNLDGTECKLGQACQTGQYLSRGGCVDCPDKCGSCINGDSCTSCASGYVNTGSDCIKNVNVLQSVKVQITSVTQRDNIVTIQTLPSALPNDIPTGLQNEYYLVVVENVQADPVPTIWSEPPYVYVSLKYPNGIPAKDLVYLIVNTAVFGDMYLNMGYVLTEAFSMADVHRQLPPTPSTVRTSARAFSSQVEKGSARIPKLQSKVLHALKANRVIREIL